MPQKISHAGYGNKSCWDLFEIGRSRQLQKKQRAILHVCVFLFSKNSSCGQNLGHCEIFESLSTIIQPETTVSRCIASQSAELSLISGLLAEGLMHFQLLENRQAKAHKPRPKSKIKDEDKDKMKVVFIYSKNF